MCFVRGCAPDEVTAHLLARSVPYCARCERAVSPAGLDEEVGMTTTNADGGW